ncbi:tellurite resistance TerB family protein [Teichococcus oryzae]|uniref:Tellurite resistance TerB family protein n=1 Tax=Teichococcus oryzae TaxID=1608942 RepID=A0A5B2TH09_9PROT|nr:tellurite resistance TerB family protein [Pseudoroseomonas oryzae]KAA2213373.1 tellurite resistance TerB family protein [Pseudoroseomonas oryzae]
MIDAKALLNQFLGAAGAPGQARQPPQGQGVSPWTHPGAATPPTPPEFWSGGNMSGLAEAARQVLGQGAGQKKNKGGIGGLASAAAAGGLMSVLMGKKGKKRGGGMLSHGGAALLGALADRAFQNWQAGRQPASAPAATASDARQVDARFLPEARPAAGGEPFELALIRAMIGAARADGHIDAEERRRIFAQVEEAGLDAEAKAFVFDTLDAPIGVSEVAAAATTAEQAAELYLVSRLAMDPDDPAERAYLQALAHRLKLAPDLVAHLDRQADATAG